MIISKKLYLELLQDNDRLRLKHKDALNIINHKNKLIIYLEAENKRLSQVVEDTANMVKKIQEEL